MAKTQRVLGKVLAIEVDALSQVAGIANYVAPEHLELLVDEAAVKKMTAAITTAGAIMIGNHTPTALGDYGGAESCAADGQGGSLLQRLARGGFLRRTSIIRYDRPSVRKAEPTVAAFAAMEKLDTHRPVGPDSDAVSHSPI